MSDSGKAVFLSYASQDAAAAKRICEALRAAGVEVWFDQSELVGGDAWDQKIRKQIKECALLIPIISQASNARSEGYFRLEWRLADQRTHLMGRAKPFLLPVCIDDTTDAEADVPDSFAAVQWTRLPGGETSAKFCEHVQALLRGETGSARSPAARRPVASNQTPSAPATKPRKIWPLVIGSVGTIAAAGIFFMMRSKPSPSPVPVALAPAAAVADFPHDPELKRVVKLIYSINAIPEDFALAEDILKPVLAARPNDPEVVTVAAQVAQEYLTRGFDVSEARRGQVQKLTERAVLLAPDNPDAMASLGRYLSFIEAQLPRAESLLRHAIELNPAEPRYHRILLQIIGQMRPAETEAFSAQMVARFPHDPLVHYDIARGYKDRDDLAGAERAMNETVAIAPVPSALVWKAWIALEAHGDVAAMKASLDGVPERQRMNTRVANALATYAGITGDTTAAIKLLEDLPDTWLSDFDFTGPKALLLGNLLVIDGRVELARLQYEAALAEIKREEARDPTGIRPRRAEFWTLLGLGRREEAHAVLQLLVQASDRPFRMTMNRSWWSGSVRGALLLGERELAVTLLKEAVGDPTGRMILRNDFNVDPRMAPLRGDAEITALLAEPDAGKPDAATIADKNSVAVLAFTNLSDDKANEYFSDGISEELLNVLAKIPGLKVSARTSAFYFKGKEVPVPEIARQLGVAYVVEGSVRKSGDKVRITAQLIKATDGFHVWSDTFTRDLKDIFAVQDEIAGLIAGNLELKMGMTAPRPTVDLEAYQEYLAGRAAAARAGNADLKEALTHFERAVAIEPKFTAAWVQLASAHTRLGRWGGAPTLQAWAAARVAIDKARALEPDSPDMLIALGWILRTADWDWRGAEQAFQRALTLQPNQPEALAGAAVLAFNVGKTEEAYRLGHEAVRLDPLNAATHIDLSLMFYLNRNWIEAERSARRALQLAPGGTSYHGVLAWCLAAQQRYAEAAKEAAQENDPVEGPTAFGLLALARGETKEVRAQLAQLENVARTNGDSADLQQTMAWLYAGLGEKDRAFAALERAAASRDPSMSWLLNSWYLEPLFSDPRWPVLVRKVGLSGEQLK